MSAKKWYDNNCKEEAKKYTTRSEFQKGNISAYQVARENDWLKEYEWLTSLCKPNGFWNYETCYQEAKKYKTRSEFKKGNISAYQVARKNDWLKEYEWFISLSKPNGFWNYDNCKEEAKKYKTRSEFKKGNISAYQVALKNKWLDDYIWLENKNIYIDKVDCVYAYFFENKNIYVGRTIDKKGRDWNHIFSDDTVSKYAKKNNYSVPKMIIIEDNLTLKKGVEREGYWVEYYRNSGYTILNKVKTGSIGSIGQGKWTKKTCIKEAKKYKTRSEFKKGNISAYQVARKNDWLKEYEWLTSLCKPDGFWNYETCYQEAKKYTTRSEFSKGSSGAYNVARKNDWLKEYEWLISLCKPNGFWNYDNCKEEAKKYKTRNEFQKGSSGAYNVARKNKWLDDFYPKNN